ncbi:MAG TPA: thaumatin family protein [Polyangiaceae bacterium]|jgi:hypothetical protein
MRTPRTLLVAPLTVLVPAAALLIAPACSSSGSAHGGGASDGGGDGTVRGDGAATPDGGGTGEGGVTHGEGAASPDGEADGGSGAPDGSLDAPGSEGAPAPTCDAGAVAAGDRILTVTNDCPGETVVLGVNGGFVQDCAGGTCPQGMTCLTTRNPPGCFWDLPSPACGSPVLAPGAAATYVLTAPASGGTKWSGNLYASTGCAADGSGCKTAQCATSVAGKTVVQACPDGTGPGGPTTLAEFTLSTAGADFYDVSSINGVNVPVAMGAVGGAPDPANPYTCATAGAVTQPGGLVGCSWSFDPTVTLGGAASDESTLLRAVTPGGAACSSTADCSGSDVCGTAVAFGGTAATTSCGAQVGWWTADELCEYTGNGLGAPIACSLPVGGQGTNDDLYGCAGANGTSCYDQNAGATCCGCPQWAAGGAPLAIPPGFTCHATNPSWTSAAEPWAAFVKNACPTAYSFPFDDATSTFTCASAGTSAASPNTMGYAITFCPGGKTGF